MNFIEREYQELNGLRSQLSDELYEAAITGLKLKYSNNSKSSIKAFSDHLVPIYNLLPDDDSFQTNVLETFSVNSSLETSISNKFGIDSEVNLESQRDDQQPNENIFEHNDMKENKVTVTVLSTTKYAIQDVAAIILDRAELNDTKSCLYRCIEQGADIRAATHENGITSYFEDLASIIISENNHYSTNERSDQSASRNVDSENDEVMYVKIKDVSCVNFELFDNVVIPFLDKFFGPVPPERRHLAALLYEAMIYVIKSAKDVFDSIGSSMSDEDIPFLKNASEHDTDASTAKKTLATNRKRIRNVNKETGLSISRFAFLGQDPSCANAPNDASQGPCESQLEMQETSPPEGHYPEPVAFKDELINKFKIMKSERKKFQLQALYQSKMIASNCVPPAAAALTDATLLPALMSGARSKRAAGDCVEHAISMRRQKQAQAQSASSSSQCAESVGSKRGSLTRRKRLKIMHHPSVKELVFEPKGIYDTPHGYRVQLNLPGSSHKFSRNVKTFTDAVWLYEIAILISDRPVALPALMESGNYNAIVPLKLVATPEEYYNALSQQIQKFLREGKIKLNEADAAIEVFDNLLPLDGLSFAQRGLSCRSIPATLPSSGLTPIAQANYHTALRETNTCTD